ncbi:MAG: hypothetical protein JXR37_23845 [Kiritimatiellae bacterium]|nr:hypothetical protein [Kiritimatiellia bacterium]
MTTFVESKDGSFRVRQVRLGRMAWGLFCLVSSGFAAFTAVSELLWSAPSLGAWILVSMTLFLFLLLTGLSFVGGRRGTWFVNPHWIVTGMRTVQWSRDDRFWKRTVGWPPLRFSRSWKDRRVQAVALSRIEETDFKMRRAFDILLLMKNGKREPLCSLRREREAAKLAERMADKSGALFMDLTEE